MLRILDVMRPHAGDVPLVAKPNAGGPARVGERIVYPATAEYLGEYARAFVASGASIIGGCCGTGAEHIKAMAEALAEPRQLHLEILPTAPIDAGHESVASKSVLGAKLEEGRFVVTVEMDPPREHVRREDARGSSDAQGSRRGFDQRRRQPDGTHADESVGAGAPHPGRDRHRDGAPLPDPGRNLLRIQGDLLAAHALGIRNVFVCLGDPTRIGDYPAATDNVDVVPTGLISLVKGSLNEGRTRSGRPSGSRRTSSWGVR